MRSRKWTQDAFGGSITSNHRNEDGPPRPRDLRESSAMGILEVVLWNHLTEKQCLIPTDPESMRPASGPGQHLITIPSSLLSDPGGVTNCLTG